MKLSKLKLNPDNPRFIRDENFAKLVENIKKYPKFLEHRPIIIKSFADPIVICGNMRLRALRELNYKDIPDTWVKEAKDFTDDEIKAFIVLDNSQFGEWDFNILANQYDENELFDFGVIVPDLVESETENNSVKSDSCLCEVCKISDCEKKIQPIDIK